MKEAKEILDKYGDLIALGELISPKDLFKLMSKQYSFDTYIDYYREVMKDMKVWFYRSKTGHLSTIENAALFFNGPASAPWSIGVMEMPSTRTLVRIEIDMESGHETRQMYERLKAQLESKYATLLKK